MRFLLLYTHGGSSEKFSIITLLSASVVASQLHPPPQRCAKTLPPVCLRHPLHKPSAPLPKFPTRVLVTITFKIKYIITLNLCLYEVNIPISQYFELSHFPVLSHYPVEYSNFHHSSHMAVSHMSV